MANLKTIRRRITSVRNTKQITRAMKLVSAAKLRRAQDSAVNGRAFAEQLSQVTGKLVQALSGKFEHPLSRNEAVRNRLVIVIAGERGLCGPFNSNMFKKILREESGSDVTRKFLTIGRRTVAAAHRFRWDVFAEYSSLPENIASWPLEQIISKVVSAFQNKEFEEVVIYYTKFVSAVTQVVSQETLLPIKFSSAANSQKSSQSALAHGFLKFDMNPAEILSGIIPLLLRTKLAQASLESKASEHAARMTAMDNATSNADELIGKLRLFYNRERQATITRELLDILGGAEALQS